MKTTSENKFAAVFVYNDSDENAVYVFNGKDEAELFLKAELDSTGKCTGIKSDNCDAENFQSTADQLVALTSELGICNILPIEKTKTKNINGPFAVIATLLPSKDGCVYLFNTEKEAKDFLLTSFKNKQNEEISKSREGESITTMYCPTTAFVSRNGYDCVNPSHSNYCYFSFARVYAA